MNEWIENLIDKIITLNTFLRLSYPEAFEPITSFEVFESMWWSRYYNLGKAKNSIRLGYAFYLLHKILRSYKFGKELDIPFKNRNFEINHDENNPCFVILRNGGTFSDRLCVDIETLIDYLGNTPVDDWGKNYKNLRKFDTKALQNEN